MLSRLKDLIRALHREASESDFDPDSQEILDDLNWLSEFGHRHLELSVEVTEAEVRDLLGITGRMRARAQRRYAGSRVQAASTTPDTSRPTARALSGAKS